MDLTIIGTTKLDNPKFIKPFRLLFKQNGKERSWECISAISSVSALLYHTQKDAFLLVKQFRPAVWHSMQLEGINASGFTYELCAGLLDKGISKEATIIEEIEEETGYKVENVTKISSARTGFGFSGNAQTMFYAQIDESMKISSGGGVEDENIELFFLNRKDAKKFIFDESYIKGFGLGFALFWWQDKFKLSIG